MKKGDLVQHKWSVHPYCEHFGIVLKAYEKRVSEREIGEKHWVVVYWQGSTTFQSSRHPVNTLVKVNK